MEIAAVATAALLASGLTLFSGFGLGTLLMPVAALFFPVEVAIGITALVHLANNLFKFALLGKHADRDAVLRFGLPAVAAAFLGALLLARLAALPPVFEYTLAGKTLAVMPVKLIIGALILGFVGLELSPAAAALKLDRRFLPLGGCMSGFFGGLSGHQGAFRSMFLIKAGLDKERFIATGIVLSVMVDVARMLVYGWQAGAAQRGVDWTLVAVASLSAFAGAFVGARLIKKVTLGSIRALVSLLLAVVGVGLITGVL